jgi:hypothetical protein
MGCQTHIAAQILDQGGDYLLTLKRIHKKAYAAKNMAALRPIALHLLRQERSHPISLRQKRLVGSLDERYLLTVLSLEQHKMRLPWPVWASPDAASVNSFCNDSLRWRCSHARPRKRDGRRSGRPVGCRPAPRADPLCTVHGGERSSPRCGPWWGPCGVVASRDGHGLYAQRPPPSPPRRCGGR